MPASNERPPAAVLEHLRPMSLDDAELEQLLAAALVVADNCRAELDRRRLRAQGSNTWETLRVHV